MECTNNEPDHAFFYNQQSHQHIDEHEHFCYLDDVDVNMTTASLENSNDTWYVHP